MKALVTGAGGFLGRYIVEQLVARGDHVRGLARQVLSGARPRWASSPCRRTSATRTRCVRRSGQWMSCSTRLRCADIWGPWELFLFDQRRRAR